MQNKVNNILDKKLVNNEKHLCNEITSYLAYKCEVCDLDLFNKDAVNSEGKHLCERCVHHFCFCVIDGCDKMESWKNIMQNTGLLFIRTGWKCKQHSA